MLFFDFQPLKADEMLTLYTLQPQYRPIFTVNFVPGLLTDSISSCYMIVDVNGAIKIYSRDSNDRVFDVVTYPTTSYVS